MTSDSSPALPVEDTPQDPGLLRSSLSFLVIGGVLIAALIGGMLWLADRSDRVFTTLVAERELRRTAVDLFSTLADMEGGIRGYLLSGDESYLLSYDDNEETAPRLLGEVTARLAAREEDAAVMQDLQTYVPQELALLARKAAFARAGELEQARELVRTGRGRENMRAIREGLNSLIERADGQVAAAVEEQRALIQQTLGAVVVAALMITALIAGAIFVVIRRVRDFQAAQAKLKTLNATLEDRVHQRTEDLMRANQEIQRFAYIVTHDLRAPLVNIMGFTSELDTAIKPLQAYVLADGKTVSEQDILDARVAASEDLPEAVDFIRTSARKMDGLINAILKISRDGRRQLRPERIDLEALIERTTDSVQHQIVEAGGSITMDVKVSSIISDRMSLEQILGNLVDNAIKYADPARPLELKFRVVRSGRSLVRIEVEDNGRGIAQEDHERIFELFRRAGEQNQAGEGIGLAHVRSLVRNLGGEITVRSKPKEGSTFLLRLPIDLRKFGEGVKG